MENKEIMVNEAEVETGVETCESGNTGLAVFGGLALAGAAALTVGAVKYGKKGIGWVKQKIQSRKNPESEVVEEVED